MLMHGDEDGKSDVSLSKDRESACAIISIFQNIKRSEDNFDGTKSKVGFRILNLFLCLIHIHTLNKKKC